VTIGDGAVVAAGSTVARDVPPYAIVAGNPARLVRPRFEPDQIAALLAIRWWDWPDAEIRRHVFELCNEDVDTFIARHAPAHLRRRAPRRAAARPSAGPARWYGRDVIQPEATSRTDDAGAAPSAQAEGDVIAPQPTLADLLGAATRILVVGGPEDHGLDAGGARQVTRADPGADLAAQAGDERFDAVVLPGTLADARDPGALLAAVQPLLAEGGAVVLGVPNAAHGTVRLALLAGQADAAGIGGRRTLFTLGHLESLLDEAELGVVELRRREEDFRSSPPAQDPAIAPDAVLRRLDGDPDARTAEFLVRAEPLGRPGMRAVQARLRELAAAAADAERERDVARADLQAAERAAVEERHAMEQRLRQAEERIEELSSAFAEVSKRDGELRRALVDAHDQLLRRDREVDDLEGRLVSAETERDRLEVLREGDRDWIRQLEAAMEDQRRQIVTLRLSSGLGPRALVSRGVRAMPRARRLVARLKRG
jgi:hypothetical protein